MSKVYSRFQHALLPARRPGHSLHTLMQTGYANSSVNFINLSLVQLWSSVTMSIPFTWFPTHFNIFAPSTSRLTSTLCVKRCRLVRFMSHVSSTHQHVDIITKCMSSPLFSEFRFSLCVHAHDTQTERMLTYIFCIVILLIPNVIS
jgi:hypothetical protein